MVAYSMFVLCRVWWPIGCMVHLSRVHACKASAGHGDCCGHVAGHQVWTLASTVYLAVTRNSDVLRVLSTVVVVVMVGHGGHLVDLVRGRLRHEHHLVRLSHLGVRPVLYMCRRWAPSSPTCPGLAKAAGLHCVGHVGHAHGDRVQPLWVGVVVSGMRVCRVGVCGLQLWRVALHAHPLAVVHGGLGGARGWRGTLRVGMMGLRARLGMPVGPHVLHGGC